MSTPEIDLMRMLDRESYDEDLDDKYEHWLEYEVIPDLTKLLSKFQYDKFDKLVEWYGIYHTDPIITFLFPAVAEDFDTYWAFINQERGDINFRELTSTYIYSCTSVDDYVRHMDTLDEWK